MTNEEYKERRQALGLAIAALDKEHLEDREFKRRKQYVVNHHRSLCQTQ